MKMLFTAALLVLLSFSAASAMTVYLNNNEELEAETAWREGNVIRVTVNHELSFDLPVSDVDTTRTTLTGRPDNEAKTSDLSAVTSSALAGNQEAQYDLGVRYFEGSDVAKDYKEALKWMLLAAHQGYPRAQIFVARMYLGGYGTERNGVEAERWARKAAEAGDFGALWQMGMTYSNGWSVAVNKAEGEMWFTKWAERGGAHENFDMGEMFASGNMMPQDSSKAVYWYKRAAALGHPGAKARLAVIEAAGGNVSSGGAGWAQQLAESGDAESAYKTGVNFNHGNDREGIERDYKKALSWYKKAADKGHAGAMGAIAVLYANGTGVEKNGDLARKWWEKGAAKGDDLSITFLSWNYRDGNNNFPKSYYKAYMWCSLRGWQYGRGKSVTEECDALARKLSPEQVQKARQEASEKRAKFSTSD